MQSSLLSHQTGLSYITIQEDNNNDIKILYKKPLSDVKGEDITIVYPKICNKVLNISKTIENGYILEKSKLYCQKKGLMKSRIWIEGLRSKDRGVLISYKKGRFKKTTLVRSDTPFMHIVKENTSFKLFQEYISLGVFHILSGYDHLLFVLSLILLSLSLRQLLWSITGFTFAHSITLVFGILGIVNIGVIYVEAMIALSIMFLARELLVKGESLTKKYLGVVAFLFGLLHGLGFSNVLKTIGLPQEEIPLSLFSFNLGIEMGQLLFISIVFLLLTFFKRYTFFKLISSKRLVAYFIGCLSAFWFIQRVSAF